MVGDKQDERGGAAGLPAGRWAIAEVQRSCAPARAVPSLMEFTSPEARLPAEIGAGKGFCDSFGFREASFTETGRISQNRRRKRSGLADCEEKQTNRFGF